MDVLMVLIFQMAHGENSNAASTENWPILVVRSICPMHVIITYIYRNWKKFKLHLKRTNCRIPVRISLRTSISVSVHLKYYFSTMRNILDLLRAIYTEVITWKISICALSSEAPQARIKVLNLKHSLQINQYLTCFYEIKSEMQVLWTVGLE